MEGWGEHFSDSRLAVSGGILRFWLKQPKDYLFTIQKKYKLTQLSHPQYPWLHRNQALKTINVRVEAGELGGFVQSEQNLSQEGECWIYDDAVCCGEAVVEQDAELHDGAVAAGSAVITGDACMYDRAWAGGNCCIRSGEVKDDAAVTGEAVIKKDGKDSPPDCRKQPDLRDSLREIFYQRYRHISGRNLSKPNGGYFDSGEWETERTDAGAEVPAAGACSKGRADERRYGTLMRKPDKGGEDGGK